MSRWIILAACLAAGCLAADVDEKDVVVLTPSNFDEVINSNTNVLVEFYAPWCGHCKQLVPHYAKAATTLKKQHPEVVIAKVDCDKHKDIGSKYGVQGFPTLKWFTNGSPSEYNGGRTDDTIVSWIKKRLGPATTTLATPAEHDEFVASADVVVVGYFTDSSAEGFTKFEDGARDVDGISFGTAASAAVHDHAGHPQGSIVLHKKHDGGSKVVYSGDHSIKDWVAIHQLAHVTDFTPDSSSKIFGSPVKVQVLFFADKSISNYDNLRATFTEAAKKNFGNAVAVAVTSEHKNVMDYFGVTQDMTPCIFAVKLPSDRKGGGQMVRYKGPSGASELAVDGAMDTFISDVLAGKLTPHKKSEPVPAQVVDEHGVTTLVGSNFEDIVFDPTKDVLVEFYAPWCGHCKQLVPVYDKLAESFKDVDSVVIAKMDATANDPPEGTDVQGFPTIKFYKAGNKTPMDFSGDRTVKGFRKFIRKNAGVPVPVKKGKDKKDKAGGKTEL